MPPWLAGAGFFEFHSWSFGFSPPSPAFVIAGFRSKNRPFWPFFRFGAHPERLRDREFFQSPAIRFAETIPPERWSAAASPSREGSAKPS